MRYAGLDLGATFLKAAVLDTDEGKLIGLRQKPFPSFLPGRTGGRREIDPQSVIDAARGLLEEIVHLAPDCAGVWISGQMHGFILCDGKCRAQTPYISWQDQRCMELQGDRSYFENLRLRLDEKEISELGNELRPGHAITNLFEMRNVGVLRDGWIPMPLGDFVLAHLGNVQPVLGLTQAAALGGWDVAAGQWHKTVQAKLGLETLAWPRIARSLDPWGEIRIAGRRLPCHPTVGDQQAALLGTALGVGELSMNIATGSQVSVLVDNPVVGEYQLRPYFDGHFLRTVTHLPAGRALNALLALLTELAEKPFEDLWDRVAAAVDSVSETDLQANLAFYPCATGQEGSLVHLREDNLSVGALFRAAFSSMANNYAVAAGKLAQEWQRIVFSGGLACRMEPLRNEILARLGPAHRIVRRGEDALTGLLTLAKAASQGCSVQAAAAALGRAPDA